MVRLLNKDSEKILANVVRGLFWVQEKFTHIVEVKNPNITPCIYAMWHYNQCAIYGFQNKENTNILVSRSKDGNVVARGNTTDDIISIPGLKPGEYTIKVTTIVDENHTSTTSEAKITVRPIVDLELTKMVDKTNIKEGEKVTYTLTVKNNGPSDATGVKVTDKAITQHKFVSASSNDYDSTTGVWSIGDLANGSSVTLTVTVIIEKAGIYGNTAFVSSNENDTNMSNNNASSKDVVVTKDNHTDENETTNETTPQKAEVPTMHETGNPIFALLVVLMALMLPQLRRYKK